jgi:hypothetical protein
MERAPRLPLPPRLRRRGGGGVGVATQGRQGVKLFDYLDWCEIAKLMIDGKHLTVEGLEIIRSIKSGMNTGRKINNN